MLIFQFDTQQLTQNHQIIKILTILIYNLKIDQYLKDKIKI